MHLYIIISTANICIVIILCIIILCACFIITLCNTLKKIPMTELVSLVRECRVNTQERLKIMQTLLIFIAHFRTSAANSIFHLSG